MKTINASETDVTRNGAGEVLISLAVPERSGLKDGATLFLGQENGAWQAVLRDPYADTTVLLPALPNEGITWILMVPPFKAKDDPDSPIPHDPRRQGIKYVMVCEVVDTILAAGYAARVHVHGR